MKNKNEIDWISQNDVEFEYPSDVSLVCIIFLDEDIKGWSRKSVIGISEWLQRVKKIWSLPATKLNLRSKSFMNLIKEISVSNANLTGKSVILEIMNYVNSVYKKGKVSRVELLEFLDILSPLTPNMAKEIKSEYYTMSYTKNNHSN